MNRRAGVVLVVALLLLPVGLLGGIAKGASSGPYTQAAFIYNLGAGDFAGFRIAVDPNGKAWAIDGGGRASGELDKDVVRRFFSDLSAASPLEKLPTQPCPATRPDIQTPTDINAALIVTWHGKSSPDLTCAHDQRAQNLRFDAASIQRALAVQSYRVRTVVFGQSTATTQSVATNYQQPSSYLSRYAFTGYGFSNSTAASSYTNLSPETAFSSDNKFTNEPFSGGRFSNEPFSSQPFRMQPFSDRGFSNGGFQNEVFNNGAGFSNDFGSNAFTSGFSANFGNGSFGAGWFGSGGFTSPQFNNGGFGGGNFSGGTFYGLPGY